MNLKKLGRVAGLFGWSPSSTRPLLVFVTARSKSSK